MNAKLILGMIFLTLPVCLRAQVDDAYFVPSKAQKKMEKEARLKEMQMRHLETLAQKRAHQDAYDVVNYDEAQDAPDYHVGNLRDEDEYNRRGKSYAKLIVAADTIYFDEEDLNVPEQALPEYYEEDMSDDYGYSSRLVRFHGGLASPYYWDYYYDWAYDPWLRFGWAYDPWYDYYYGLGYGYRPYYSWHYGWHDPWYAGWYDPWYGGGWGHPGGPDHPGHPGGGIVPDKPVATTSVRGARQGTSNIASIANQRLQNNWASLNGGRTNSRTSNSAAAKDLRAQRNNGYRTENIEGINNGRLTTTQRVARTTTIGGNQPGQISINGNTNQRQTATQRVTTSQNQQNQRVTTNTTTSRSSNTTTTSRSVNTTTPTVSSGGGFSTGGSFGGGNAGGGASRSTGSVRGARN